MSKRSPAVAPEVDAYGWLPLSREFFECPFWTEPRVLSRAEAWLDLLASAAYKPHHRIVGSAMVIKLETGQFLGSWTYLQTRWQWTERRVRDFLELLLAMGWITAGRTTRKGRIYTVDSARFMAAMGRESGGDRDARASGKRRGSVGELSGKRREEKEGKKGTREMKSTATGARETETIRRARQEQMDLIAGALDCEDLSVDEAEDLRRLVDAASTIDHLDEVTRRRYALVDARHGKADQQLFGRYHRQEGVERG